jgi:molecular chaperone Hsp33
VAQEIIIDRYLLREHSVLAARGEFTALFADYVAHSRRWVGDPDGLVLTMMRQGLAAAALYLTCRPRDEQTAWTINLPEPPLNLFITADAARGRVVGRYFDEDVKSTPRNRLFVQTVRSTGEPHLSAIEVTGFDVLRILEQHYVQSEQATARFFEGDSDDFVMLMALPGVDEEWLQGISREDGLGFAHWPESRLIEKRPVTFECICAAERIIEIVAQMFRNEPEELFAANAEAEARCPRCGRAYEITRAAFEEALGKMPPADGEEGSDRSE